MELPGEAGNGDGSFGLPKRCPTDRAKGFVMRDLRERRRAVRAIAEVEKRGEVRNYQKRDPPGW